MANRADMPKAGFDSVKFYLVVGDIKGPFLTNESDTYEEVMQAWDRWVAIGIEPMAVQRVVVTNINPKVLLHVR